MNEIKQQILDKIMSSPYVPVFIKVSEIQYRIRCPICGDSTKNAKDAHCYIKCSYDPMEPLLYNCFLCGAKGKISKSFLEKLGISDNNLNDILNKISNNKYNKIKNLVKYDVNIITGTPISNSPQIKYIEDRLGEGLSLEDYDKFKIIWNMNSIMEYITYKRTLNTLPSNTNTISFLSDDKSYLLTRFMADGGFRWRKIKLFQSKNKIYYTIKSVIDIFTRDTITINIAEGIFDVLSIYKNFSTDISVYLAVLGSDYIDGLEYLMMKGFIGSNIVVKIYVDSDVDEKPLKKQLKKYKWLFNKITILKNIKNKDVGVKIDKIKLLEYDV